MTCRTIGSTLHRGKCIYGDDDDDDDSDGADGTDEGSDSADDADDAKYGRGAVDKSFMCLIGAYFVLACFVGFLAENCVFC